MIKDDSKTRLRETWKEEIMLMQLIIAHTKLTYSHVFMFLLKFRPKMRPLQHRPKSKALNYWIWKILKQNEDQKVANNFKEALTHKKDTVNNALSILDTNLQNTI